MIKRIGVFQSGELPEEQRRAQRLSYFESREPAEITRQRIISLLDPSLCEILGVEEEHVVVVEREGRTRRRVSRP